jgi:transcription initiation factor IIE alpha subunit
MIEHPRARNTDPSTSHLAADLIKDSAKIHFETILNCLQRNGALGKDGIAALTNLDRNQISRRLSELQREGLIELTGRVVKSRANRLEREWRFMPQQASLL